MVNHIPFICDGLNDLVADAARISLQSHFPDVALPPSIRDWIPEITRVSGLSEGEIFSLLSTDKQATRLAGASLTLVDPALLPACRRLGGMGEDFLLLARSEATATLVTHTPFLLMSEASKQRVKSQLSVSRIDLLYALPERFEAAKAIKQPSEDQHDRLVPMGETLPGVDLNGFAGGFSDVVPVTMQRRYSMVPVYCLAERFLTLAVTSEPDVFLRSEIRSHLKDGLEIAYVIADGESIGKVISANELNQTETLDLVSRLGGAGMESGQGKETVSIDVSTIAERAGSNDASIIPLLDAILAYAIKHGASDLHIAPFDDGLAVEYRVDDWKQPYPERVPGRLAAPIVSRLKYLSNIDIQRMTDPQYGRFTMTIRNVGDIEVRTTVMPTVYGDSVTLRFAPKGGKVRTLEENGMQPREIGIVQRVVDGSSGLLMVVGPTGSGKSTTLYSVLASIEVDKWEVLSAEEPPERYIPGIKQTDITRGMTYPAFLAGALRADPDYINIGETRTPDTAAQLIRAVETGHICFTTLHTAQACGAPGRMFGLGVPSYSLADALSAVIAQTLVAKVCPRCSFEVTPPDKVALKELGIRDGWFGNDPSFREGKGCSHCMGRGFRGRTLVAEGYHVDSSMRELILKGAPSDEIRRAQEAQGGKTLLQQACEMAAAGMLPLSKVLALGASGRE